MQIALTLLFKIYFNILIQSFRSSSFETKHLYEDIILCRRVIWCITINCTRNPHVSFFRL
jgi:hypothetical protein